MRLIVLTALMVLVATAGFGADGEQEKQPKPETGEAEERDESGAAQDAALTGQRLLASSGAPAQGSSGSRGMHMELFVSPGLTLVNVAAEDSLGFPGVMSDELHSFSRTRSVSEFGWGGGARLMSGNWGIEGTYKIFESLALSPGWIVSDDRGSAEPTTGLLDLPVVASRADVLVGQVVRAFPLSGGTAELFIGVGAGWMRATDSSTDRLLSGVQAPAPDVADLPEGVPPGFLETLIPETRFTANRSSVVYTGSVGLSLRLGRMLLRPRVDAIIGSALTTELTLAFPGLAELVPPDAGDVGDLEFSFATSVTPRIFLLSVDIGLGN